MLINYFQLYANQANTATEVQSNTNSARKVWKIALPLPAVQLISCGVSWAVHFPVHVQLNINSLQNFGFSEHPRKLPKALTRVITEIDVPIGKNCTIAICGFHTSCESPHKNCKNGGAYWKRGLLFTKTHSNGGSYSEGALIGRRALNRIITVCVFILFYYSSASSLKIWVYG